MVDAAICDGDWVVVRQQNVADNGDIVAAMIDGEATVKTFKRTGGQVRLMPHNPAFDPIPGNDARHSGQGRHRHPPRSDGDRAAIRPCGIRWPGPVLAGEPHLGNGVLVELGLRRVVQTGVGCWP